MKRSILVILLINSILWISGCGNSDSPKDDTNITSSDGDTNASVGEVNTTDIGYEVIKLKILKRTDHSIKVQAKVQSDTGIKDIKIYCIDKYKLQSKTPKTVVVAKVEKVYDSQQTNLKFVEYIFTKLHPGKAYVIKVVSQTELKTLQTQTLTATIPGPKPITKRPELPATDFFCGTLTATSNVISLNIVDSNAFQDEYFNVYINGVYLGAVENAVGASTLFTNINLNSGNNLLEMKITDKVISDTRLLYDITPGNSNDMCYSDDKNQIWTIVAP